MVRTIEHPRIKNSGQDYSRRRTSFLILVVLLVSCAWLTWRIIDASDDSGVWSGHVLIASGLVASLVSLINARHFAERRGTWLLIASGSLVWTVAYLLRDVTDEVGVLTYTCLFLCTAILLIAGCLRMTGLGGQPWAIRSLLIDLFPPIVALLTVVWLINIGPFVAANDLRWQYQVSAALHGLAAVALVVVGLAGLLSWQSLHIPASVQTMMAGLAILAVADGLWLQRWIDRDVTFGLTADVAFCIGFVTIAVAGLQFRIAGQARDWSRAHTVIAPRVGRQSTGLSLATLFALIGIQAEWGELSRNGIVITAGAGMTLVLFVIMWENLISARESVLTDEIDTLSERIDGLVSQVGRDPLTGLLNRRAFRERLEYELQAGRNHSRPVAIALIDVDNFKGVNDSLGHAVGDQVLQAIASLLIGVARGTDVAARYAGDEFVMIFPGVDEATASQICLRLIDGVNRISNQIEPLADVRIGLSVGIALTEVCKRNVSQLVAIADAAMYDAKEGGKNRVVAVNADTLVTRSWWGSEPAQSTLGAAIADDRRPPAFPAAS
jgi:diguanylate cyclase (GGDEF)-like protein